MSNVRIMPRTSIYGSFDHGIFGGLEIKYDNYIHRWVSQGKFYGKFILSLQLFVLVQLRGLWLLETMIDHIMLSGAIRSYVNRWSVCPGKNVVIFTNDDGWRTAQDLKNKI